MNIKLTPGNVDKKTIKLINRDEISSLAYSFEFKVIEFEHNEQKVFKIVREKGEKSILERNNNKTNIIYFV